MLANLIIEVLSSVTNKGLMLQAFIESRILSNHHPLTGTHITEDMWIEGRILLTTHLPTKWAHGAV
jgi:hypothetical protein